MQIFKVVSNKRGRVGCGHNVPSKQPYIILEGQHNIRALCMECAKQQNIPIPWDTTSAKLMSDYWFHGKPIEKILSSIPSVTHKRKLDLVSIAEEV